MSSMHKIVTYLFLIYSFISAASTKLPSYRVSSISVEGNKRTPSQAILNKALYVLDEIYSPFDGRQSVQNIMNMNLFETVSIEGEIDEENASIAIIIMLKEKPLLQELVIEGNRFIGLKEINKKIDKDTLNAVDENDIKNICNTIKRLYADKNFHHTEVVPTIINNNGKIKATIIITEGKKTVVKRVLFEGNKHFSAKKLRSLLFTREDWLLAFTDRAGSYQPQALLMDKQTIEHFYNSQGYFNAKVINTQSVIDEHTKQAVVIFHIHEGEQYTISEVILKTDTTDLDPIALAAYLPVKSGYIYSRQAIQESLEIIRDVWGAQGYLYADVVPTLDPDDDTHTIKVTFYIQPGQKVSIGKIIFIGNNKTRDKVIRRQLLMQEGGMLTNQNLENSKQSIESLGYFDQKNGVSYKISRLENDKADVEFMVTEVKTGRFELQLGLGGSPKDIGSAGSGGRIGLSLSDTNLFGKGIGANFNGSYAKDEQQVAFNITQPYLFDKPIYCAFDSAFKNSLYSDFKLVVDEIKERMSNASLSTGVLIQRFNNLKCIAQLGLEDIRYKNRPAVNTSSLVIAEEQQEFTRLLNDRFYEGTFLWTGIQCGQDLRNHPIHPSNGYQWLIQNKIGLPGFSSSLGFWKIDCDASWYNALIGDRSLVFYLHTHFGITGSLSSHYSVPFRELYHIGGPSSVRGYTFGDIGPSYKKTDSLGATKAFWLNAELIFPIAPDLSVKGVLFYDGGAGWHTPHAHTINPSRLRNNNFDFRQALGFGLRIYKPMPIKIDWGFKIDKRKGEPVSEVHFTMAQDF